MRKILIKYWKNKRLMGLHSSENITDFTNYDISESNLKCEKCTRQMCNDMEKVELLKEQHILVRLLKIIDNEPGYYIFGFF